MATPPRAKARLNLVDEITTSDDVMLTAARDERSMYTSSIPSAAKG